MDQKNLQQEEPASCTHEGCGDRCDCGSEPTPAIGGKGMKYWVIFFAIYFLIALALFPLFQWLWCSVLTHTPNTFTFLKDVIWSAVFAVAMLGIDYILARKKGAKGGDAAE